MGLSQTCWSKTDFLIYRKTRHKTCSGCQDFIDSSLKRDFLAWALQKPELAPIANTAECIVVKVLLWSSFPETLLCS